MTTLGGSVSLVTIARKVLKAMGTPVTLGTPGTPGTRDPGTPGP